MHLQLAETMRSRAEESAAAAEWQLLLCPGNWPNFFFGSVAPDYETISGVPRSATHFYRMPPSSVLEGPRAMLTAFPCVSPGKDLAQWRAAFTAAYLAHLYIDLKWHFQVVMPYFAAPEQFADRHLAYRSHLALLTYLDARALASLSPHAKHDLEVARTVEVLPFDDQGGLGAWQAYLVNQLRPGAATQTVAIFAGRLQMTPQAFAAKLEDRDWMEKELFSRVPVPAIQQLLEESVVESLDLIVAYWRGQLV
ncbi:MAG: zinc dependent phospholipase C family protein [Candidatus Promineifilaceae bacterium]